MFEVTEYEITTRRLFSDAMPKVRDLTGSAGHLRHCLRLLVARTFIAEAAHSLPVDAIERTGSALTGLTLTNDHRAALRKELSNLVREKVLRTRRSQGKTLYEVNY